MLSVSHSYQDYWHLLLEKRSFLKFFLNFFMQIEIILTSDKVNK